MAGVLRLRTRGNSQGNPVEPQGGQEANRTALSENFAALLSTCRNKISSDRRRIYIAVALSENFAALLSTCRNIKFSDRRRIYIAVALSENLAALVST